MNVLTLSLRMAGFSPQNGRVGKPGFGGLLSGPGRGVIVMPPVSIHEKKKLVPLKARWDECRCQKLLGS